MTDTQTGQESRVQVFRDASKADAEPDWVPPSTSTTKPEQSFIQHEPPTQQEPPQYEPPKEPVREAGPAMVVPLNKVPGTTVNVDCPYCKKVVRTEVRHVDSGNDGMMQCLICLVCWPMLLCYQGDQDIDHHCSVCKRKLTHQASGSGLVQVVADANPQPNLVPSKYEQSS